LEGESAYLFAGKSGAGKSTAAQLSYPRPVLSDEATIVKIEDGRATAFNSPFRSDTEFPVNDRSSYPIEGIHMLRQAAYNMCRPMAKPEGFMELLSRVFYWSKQSEETKKITRLSKTLINTVPIYELHFRKDHTFWEEISGGRVQA
jgi:ABC-type dipeptide/oligopeptide/nickel transport system ATPase component